MRCFPVVMLWVTACGPGIEPEVPATLEQASQTVEFASVDRLGAHHALATVVRTSGENRSEEVVEIRWQDWDHFVYRRLVDGEAKLESVVSNGRGWTRKRSGKWNRRDDAELQRVQLRTTWNTWDLALEQFLGQIELVEEGKETVEGRPATRFKVRLRPGQALERGPIELNGTVWIDSATAVRLKADVKGVLKVEEGQREVAIQLVRTQIGESQDIRSPVKTSKKGKSKTKAE